LHFPVPEKRLAWCGGFTSHTWTGQWCCGVSFYLFTYFSPVFVLEPVGECWSSLDIGLAGNVRIINDWRKHRY
jgi:hypothetical protein